MCVSSNQSCDFFPRRTREDTVVARLDQAVADHIPKPRETVTTAL